MPDSPTTRALPRGRLSLYLAFYLLTQVCLSSADAQPIAIIKSRNVASFNEILDPFSAESQTNSWQVVEFNLDGKEKNGKKIATQVRSIQPQLVLAFGPLAAQVAKEQLDGIPTLYCMVSNPQRYDLSGEHIAGISLDVPGAIQFTYYQEMVPDLKTLGVIYDPQKSETLVIEARKSADRMGLELIGIPVSSHKKVPEALRGMLGKIDALWMVPDDTVLTTDSFRFLLVTTFKNKLPFFAISDIFVKVGALATIAPAPREMGKQLLDLTRLFLAGRLDLASIDALSPVATNLIINTKTADKIGLKLSPGILQTADKLYQ
ncbi:MAG: putative ABC transport system substrate-binding protein [Candidatus Latescibacterota bacterium]|jgi:putative ABC transport system substrate-binding protein